MTDRNFLVSGTAISPSVQGLLKLPKRKFYNAAIFSDNNQQPRHEIANHYRDFKLRRRTTKRKKPSSLYYCGKTEAAKDFSLDYQQELPMAVHMFPNFEKVYTPRAGHHKFCEQRRPVLIYNDTIKRIQSSKENTELLKNLAKKQVERLKHHNLCKKWSNKLNICKFEHNNNRRSPAKLDNIDYFEWQPQFKSGCGVIRPLQAIAGRWEGVEQHGNTCTGNFADETLKYYLQSATDFYQKGFLRNIKYLENLGERNQLRRRRHAQQQQPQQQQQQSIQQQKLKFHTIGYLSAAIGNSCATEHITDASLSSCDRKQSQINQNNPILWRHTHELEVNKCPPNNCAIRVNIKPQSLCANNQPANIVNKKIYGKKKTIQESKDFVSMNDYLNGNLKYTTQLLQQEQQLQQQQQQRATTFERNTSANNHNYPEKVLLLDNLIYNLKELDIQENRTNLPRITLTDYTDKYPNELEANFQTPAKEKPLNSGLIKQSSLDCYQLNIPLETHFQSEARPP